jgi:hypothetical protein
MINPTTNMMSAPISMGRKAMILVAKVFHAPVTTVVSSISYLLSMKTWDRH